MVEVTPNADPELARALLDIQHDAYALEALLIDDDRIPALHEILMTFERRRCFGWPPASTSALSELWHGARTGRNSI